MCCASTLLVRQVPFPSSTRVLFPGDGGFCPFGLVTQRDVALRAGGAAAVEDRLSRSGPKLGAALWGAKRVLLPAWEGEDVAARFESETLILPSTGVRSPDRTANASPVSALASARETCWCRVNNDAS